MRYVMRTRWKWPVPGVVLAMIMGGMPLLAQPASGPVVSAPVANAKPADRLAPDDEDISDAVDRALLLDPGVNSLRVDISTTGGIVTLTGTVDNVLARERAADCARTVRGVRAVVNRITIDAPDVSDSRLKADVEDALLSDPATESYEILVKAENGKVTLEGTVDSYAEKRLAETVTRSVRGVESLDSKLVVSYSVMRTPAEILADVQEVLKWDRYIDDVLIDVAVDGSTVKLSGSVGSAAERRRAELKAHVLGVQTVDISGLEVKKWARDEMFRTKKYVNKTDAEIADAVKDACLYDPRVASYKIDVDVDADVVKLRGVVEDLKAKRAAAEDARNTVGVWQVKNYLKVRPAVPVKDLELVDHVLDALRRDPYVESYEISVIADNGVVTLTGLVDTWFERGQADDIASRVKGVVDVQNKLVVDYDFEHYTYDPYVDDWYGYDYDWYIRDGGVISYKSDWEIRQDIQDELWWSPFVDEDEVTVTVSDGAATLTGTVDTWSEYQAARDNAFEGGAYKVINNLEVNSGSQ